MMSATWSIVI